MIDLSMARGGATLALAWLVRLRWFAMAAQVTTCALAVWVFHLDLPWGILGPCIFCTACSNAALVYWKVPFQRKVGVVIPAVVALDIVVLTTMLFFTGGAHNPFTMLYILHIVLAVILLPPWGAWSAVVLCTAGFGLLFLSNHELRTVHGEAICSDFDFHLQGMVVGLVVTGSGVAYFVGRLNTDLRNQRHALRRARKAAEQRRRFEGLATLAAGVAHELATPLGTIAVVSADLENSASTSCNSHSCAADARLVRTEVERCRQILGRLGRKPVAEPESQIRLSEIPALLSHSLPPDTLEHLEFVTAREDTFLQVPATGLVQCLAILIKNGAEASAPNGTVRIKIQRENETVLFEILDKGHGMDGRTVERLGEPFFTTKPPGQGMGLGLFLVRKFCQDTGASLEIDSLPGRGTTVRLVIPSPRVSHQK